MKLERTQTVLQHRIVKNRVLIPDGALLELFRLGYKGKKLTHAEEMGLTFQITLDDGKTLNVGKDIPMFATWTVKEE